MDNGIRIPSPAIAVVGRHNSGKTTLVVKLISELVHRGMDVGSVKHHSHPDFDIDYPGKDSYRQREAGASETVIASPAKMARIKSLEHEVECAQIVQSMPGHDVIVVEGYRKSGLPTIEIMRAANESDAEVAKVFHRAACEGRSLGEDSIQIFREERNAALSGGSGPDGNAAPNGYKIADDLIGKAPTASTVAVVTDIPEAIEAANIYGIPAFGLEDIVGLADFVERHFCRQHVSVVIQAGGESRRMGRSKATVPFHGRPLICRMVERLSPVADELIITTNEADSLGFLEEMYPDEHITLVKDVYEFRGALPGLYTALSAASEPFVAVVACDMVFASAPLVIAEANEMAETGADIVIPVNKHGFEPFHAMYRRETCSAAIKKEIESGSLRAQAFFNDPNIKVCEFSQQKVLEVEPRGGCFINANTPEDLKHLEESYLSE